MGGDTGICHFKSKVTEAKCEKWKLGWLTSSIRGRSNGSPLRMRAHVALAAARFQLPVEHDWSSWSTPGPRSWRLSPRWWDGCVQAEKQIFLTISSTNNCYLHTFWLSFMYFWGFCGSISVVSSGRELSTICFSSFSTLSRAGILTSSELTCCKTSGGKLANIVTLWSKYPFSTAFLSISATATCGLFPGSLSGMVPPCTHDPVVLSEEKVVLCWFGRYHGFCSVDRSFHLLVSSKMVESVFDGLFGSFSGSSPHPVTTIGRFGGIGNGKRWLSSVFFCGTGHRFRADSKSSSAPSATSHKLIERSSGRNTQLGTEIS